MAAVGSLPPLHGSRPIIRRLSSLTATRDDLIRGPAVIVPEKHLMSPSEAHETALALEMAKYHLGEGSSGDSSPEEGSTRDTTPGSPSATTTTDCYAFAFDIDGVLIRGGKPIPAAVEAMKILNGQNEWGIKVEVVQEMTGYPC
jgi:hypothetical protein